MKLWQAIVLIGVCFWAASWAVIYGWIRLSRALWWAQYKKHMKLAWHESFDRMRWDIQSKSGPYPAKEIAEADQHLSLVEFQTKYGVRRDFSTKYGVREDPSTGT